VAEPTTRCYRASCPERVPGRVEYVPVGDDAYELRVTTDGDAMRAHLSAEHRPAPFLRRVR